VLSKEIAIALIPAMAVLAARQVPRESRAFAVVGWIALVVAVIATYPLLALLKGELFPAGTMLGGSHPHVSLLCSLQWQTTRGPHDGGIFNLSSDFWRYARHWAYSDPLLVIGGSLTALASIVIFRRSRIFSMIGWMILRCARRAEDERECPDNSSHTPKLAAKANRLVGADMRRR
jgi:hypothetical protein